MKEEQVLLEWAKANSPREDLIYKDGYKRQITFVIETIPVIFYTKIKEDYTEMQNRIKVISTHTSKSVTLPVFKVSLKDGTSFIMRYNFHNWKISVSSFSPVKTDFLGLFDPKKRVSHTFCEEFPKDRVYPSYAENNKQFTIELPRGYYHIFTFFWVFADYLKKRRGK